LQVLIYIPNLNQSWGGVRQYVAALLRLLHGDNDNEYFIYHDAADVQVLEAIKDIPKHNLVKSSDINQIETVFKKVTLNKLRAIPVLRTVKLKRKISIVHTLTTYCKEKGIVIIHCPYQYIPMVEGVKLITTMHDVQELHFPEFFTAEQRAQRAVDYLDFLRRADAVIVSYNHIKKDLVKYFQVNPANIKTILLQMDKLWFYKFSEKDIEVLSELDGTKYMLYPANAWKHKNHSALLEAVALLREEENLPIKVVLTGDFNNEQGRYIIDQTKKLSLDDQIIFLGIVDEKTLFSLYKKAAAVVIPTLYEAGSFPLIESILLDVPVICSDITSLPETIGNDKFTFSPLNTREIARQINRIYSDDNFRIDNLEQIKLQSKKIEENYPLPLLMDLYAGLNA
jgi:glycosyltransferase involved in cell wall biosynthesis